MMLPLYPNTVPDIVFELQQKWCVNVDNRDCCDTFTSLFNYTNKSLSNYNVGSEYIDADLLCVP